MFAQKAYNYVKLHGYEMISTKHHILHVNVCCVFPGFCTDFSCFANSSTACESFSLSIKKRADIVLVCFYVSMLCCFGYYQQIIKWIIVLEIYVTQDVISSNLVLIVLTSHRSSVQTFSNAQNLLVVAILKTL